MCPRATRIATTAGQTDVSANARSSDSPAASSGSANHGGSTFITSGQARLETPIERGVLGLFGQARWNASDRADGHRRRRGERISRDALPGDPLAFQPRPDFPKETINSVNPKLAASFAIREGTRLRGSFGTGIRPPDAFEIAFTDNSGLKPERSKSGEFGATQTLAGGAVQIDATAFFNSYTDLIISVGRTFAGSSRYRTDNISNARARGAELATAWRHDAGIGVRASYTFLDTEILAVNGSVERADAAYRRRSAAPPAAPLRRHRRVVHAMASAHLRDARCAAKPSTPSPRSGPGGLTRTPATPSSISVDRGGR